MINKKEIKKIASLAKIEIPDSDIELYSKQLSQILEYMSALNEVDTSNDDDSSNDFLNNSDNIREDNIEPSLNREDVMKLAPDSDGVYFKVPKIIDDEK